MALGALCGAVLFLTRPVLDFGPLVKAVIGSSLLAGSVLCAFAALARRFSCLRLVRVLVVLANLAVVVTGASFMFGVLSLARPSAHQVPAEKPRN
jgi:hypothetical protein